MSTLVPSLPPARPPLPPQAGPRYSPVSTPSLAHPLGSILKYTVNPTGRREGSSGALAHAQAFLVRQAHRPRAVRVRRHRRREGSFVSPLSSVRSVFCVLWFRTSLSCLLAFSPTFSLAGFLDAFMLGSCSRTAKPAGVTRNAAAGGRARWLGCSAPRRSRAPCHPGSMKASQQVCVCARACVQACV